EVDHPSGRRPRERVKLNAAGGGAQADDLAAVVDRRGKAIRTAEGAEVDHPSGGRPRERMILTAGGGAVANDLPAVVDLHGCAHGAAEGAEVDHPSGRRPRERVSLSVGGGEAGADNLAAEQQSLSHAQGPVEGAGVV